MKSFLKITQIFMILFLAFSFFSLPVSAKTTRAVSYALSGYDGSETDVFSPAEDGGGVRIFDMTAPWDFLGDAMYVKRHMRNGYCTAYAFIDTEECEGETTFTLDLANDLTPYSVIAFGVGFPAEGASSPIRAELKLSDYGGNRVTSRTYLQVPEDEESSGLCWNMLYFDISDFEGRSDAAQFTVTFTYDPSAPPNVLRVTNPYAAVRDGGGFSYIDQYLTNAIEAEGGVFGIRSGAVRPDERGQVRLSGSFLLAEQPEIGSEVFLEIELSHFVSGGFTAGIGYASGEMAYSSRIYLNSDGNSSAVYTIPVEMTAGLETFELTFDGMACDNYFRLEGIRLYSADIAEISGTPALGKVSEITRNGDSIRFSGVMEREAVREYDDTVLRFYAIPGWSSDTLSSAVEIGQTKVSTRFDYTADLSAYPHLADSCRFFAGIRTQNGRIVPMSAPVYPKAADITEKKLSNFGLYDAASVGVFESNVSHVIVDVPLDQLLTAAAQDGGSAVSLSYTVYETVLPEEEDARVIAGRTRKTALNHTLLRALDNEIDFYISAGIEVYLRLTAENPVPGLTYPESGAEHYSVMTDTPEARYFYASMVRFLCRRYSGIAGIAAGYSVNAGQHTGDTGEKDAAVYARDLAELCRITYNAASTEIPDILIVLPFFEKTAEEQGNFRFIDPKTLTVMLSSYLETMGTVPWVMMYCTETLNGILGTDILSGDALAADVRYSDSRGTAQRVRQLLDELGLKGSAAFMYFWEPGYETVMSGYYNTPDGTSPAEYLAEMFVKLCESTRARAVFLSLDRLNEHLDHEFYSFLKKTEGTMPSGAGSYRRAVADFPAVLSDRAGDLLSRVNSRLTLWDFTDQFYPLGWIPGGGVGSCLTVYSDLFSENNAPEDRYARVLRSVITLDEDSASADRKGIAAGIVLRNLSRTVDLSEVDCLEFTFALNHPGMIIGSGHETGTVVFILGSDDCRAEFAVKDASYGQIQSYVCDLSAYEFRGQVDYMGILVYGDHEIYLDLSSVSVGSSTLAQEELEGVFRISDGTEAAETDRAAIVLASGIVFVGSAIAVVLLIRHDVEEDRERRRRMQEEKHGKRERLKIRRN